MEGLSDSNFVNNIVLRTMTEHYSNLNEKIKSKQIIKFFHYSLLTLSNVNVAIHMVIWLIILNGDTIILIDGETEFLC